MLLELPAMEDKPHTLQSHQQLHTTHQLYHHHTFHHQAHTLLQMVVMLHTHMSQPAQDMRPSPMLLNQLQMDQSHTLTLKPAMEEPHHTLIQPHMPEHQTEEPSHSFQRPPQTEELFHSLNQLEEHQEEEPSPMLMKPHQTEELHTSLNKLPLPQTVEPSHMLLELPQMVEPPHTLYHLHQAHTPLQKEVMLLTHMSQPAQELKPSPMLLNQLPTDQSPMLIPKPATEDHLHTLNNPKLKPQEMEVPFQSLN